MMGNGAVARGQNARCVEQFVADNLGDEHGSIGRQQYGPSQLRLGGGSGFRRFQPGPLGHQRGVSGFLFAAGIQFGRGGRHLRTLHCHRGGDHLRADVGQRRRGRVAGGIDATAAASAASAACRHQPAAGASAAGFELLSRSGMRASIAAETFSLSISARASFCAAAAFRASFSIVAWSA
jgi:hypothetical protein